MPVKYSAWALAGILINSAVIAQTDGQPDGLGYKTDGYELGQGNTHSGPPTDYGHAHFTKPRYGNSTYHRSYHARKDVVKENGGDIYAPPLHWNPYNYYDNYYHPALNRNYGYQSNDYLDNRAAPARSAGVTIKRRLERTLDGRCFERKQENETELRIELPARECATDSMTE
ncbi:MAG: hypothetical protein AB8B48_05415 [Pseudomonadales bacterium]